MGASFLIEAMELWTIPRGEVLVVDARKREAFDRGHIPGAVHLTTYDVFVPGTDAAGMAAFASDMAARYGAAGASRDAPIVVYDDDTGMRAARELWILEYLGHRNARLLHGGLKGWSASGGALLTSAAARPAAKFEPAASPVVLATADEVNARKGTPGFVVIDTRDDLEWNGRDNTACCTRRGHIPQAVHIEWTEFLADGWFKAPEAIRALLRERGVDPDAELVPYCHRGARSANTYYALRHAGCTRVRNFIGSWHEWSARGELPIASA